MARCSEAASVSKMGVLLLLCFFLVLSLSVLPYQAVAEVISQTVDNHDGTATTTVHISGGTASDLARAYLAGGASEEESPERRRLQADKWGMLNGWFRPSHLNPAAFAIGDAFIGINSGPCPNYRDNKCEGWACQMSDTMKKTYIDVPVAGRYRIDELIYVDSCWLAAKNVPSEGKVNIYAAAFGSMNVGDIRLAVQAPITIVPEGGWPNDNARPDTFRHTGPGPNRMKVTLTVTDMTFSADMRVRLRNLRLTDRCMLHILWCWLSLGHRLVDTTVHSQNRDLTVTIRRGGAFFTQQIHFRTAFYLDSNRRCLNTERLQGNNVDCIKEPNWEYTFNSLGRTTETFASGIVYRMEFIEQGSRMAAESCQFDFDGRSTDFGVNVNIQSACDLLGVCFTVALVFSLDALITIFVNWIINLIIGGIIKQVMCEMIGSTAYEIGSDHLINRDRPGIANKGLQGVYVKLKEQVAKGLRTDLKEDEDEDVHVPNIFIKDYNYPLSAWPAATVPGYRPFPPAVNFVTSDTFKAISLGLNGLVGGPSSTPGYENKLVFQEVVDILTGNKIGAVQLGICNDNIKDGTCTLDICAGRCDGDIKAELNLKDYPKYTWGDGPYQCSCGTGCIHNPVACRTNLGETEPPYHNQLRRPGTALWNGNIKLRGIYLEGLNSFTTLKILDNGFADADEGIDEPRHTHTVENHLKMPRFLLKMKTDLELYDGYWVHRPNQFSYHPQKRSMVFTFDLVFELRNLDVRVDVMALLRPDKMRTIRVGQLLGKKPTNNIANTVSTVTDRLKCAAFGLDWAHMQRLQVAGTLHELKFINLFGGLGDILNTATTILNTGYKAATQRFLMYVTDNYVREKINEYLLENTFDGAYGQPSQTDYCKPKYLYYFSATDPNRYINFGDSKAWSAMKGLLNDVIGGVPVRTGSASINVIVQKYLEWYLPGLMDNDPALEVRRRCIATDCNGNWDVVGTEGRIEGTPADDKYLTIFNFKVENLDSIHEMTVVPLSSTRLRIQFKLGGGKIYDRTNRVYIDPGLLTFKFSMQSEVIALTNDKFVQYADELAHFTIRFANITLVSDLMLLINQNDALDLQLQMLNTPACLLAVIDDTHMDALDIGFESFRLVVDHERSARREYCASPSNVWRPEFRENQTVANPCVANYKVVSLSDALDFLQWESSTQWGAKSDNMLKFVFKGIARSVQKAYNNFPVNNRIETCLTDSIFGDSSLGWLAALIGNASNSTQGGKNFYERLAVDQSNPRFPAYPSRKDSVGTLANRAFPAASPQYTSFCINKLKGAEPGACWEDTMGGQWAEETIVLRGSFVVNKAQEFLSSPSVGQAGLVKFLKAVAGIVDIVQVYPNGTALPQYPGVPAARGNCTAVLNGKGSFCIDFVVKDLSALAGKALAFENSDFLPGLSILPRQLVVLDVHLFNMAKFEALKPYDATSFDEDEDDIPDYDARLSLTHRVYFDSLQVLLETDVTVNEIFVDADTPTPDKPLTDTIALAFQFTDFDLQMISATGINYTRVLEIPVRALLSPFSDDRCFFSMFNDNGLFFPQFQLYVRDLVGPSVAVTARGGGTPNVLSGAVGALISATIEIVFQIIKVDFPDATQGELRKFINQGFATAVNNGREAIGGSGVDRCEGASFMDCDWGNLPVGYEHYVNFLANCSQFVLNKTNEVVGGMPLTTGAFDVNSIVQYGLEYLLVSKQKLTPLIVTSPGRGDWIVEDLVTIRNGPSTAKIANIGLLSLDSIYDMKVKTYPPAQYFEVGLLTEMGNGTYINGRDFDPPEYDVADPMGFTLEFDVFVSTVRPSGVTEIIADDAFRVTLFFSALKIDLHTRALINRKNALAMNIKEIFTLGCVRAYIEDLDLLDLLLTLGDMNVEIPAFGNGPNEFGRSNRKLGSAIEVLREEAAISNLPWGDVKSRPVTMINVALRNIGTTIASMVNDIVYFKQKLENCVHPYMYMKITSGIQNETEAAMLENWIYANNSDIIVWSSTQLTKPQVTDRFTRLNFQYKTGSNPERVRNRVIASAKMVPVSPNVTFSVDLAKISPCASFNLGLLSPMCEMMNAEPGSKNISTLIKEWTTPQVNLLDRHVPADIIEGRVEINYDFDSFYDVRTSSIVKGVNSYFNKASGDIAGLMRTLTNSSEFFVLESDDTVSLEFNITTILLMVDEQFLNSTTCNNGSEPNTFRFASLLEESSTLIPSFRVRPGMLRIRNFGEFTKLNVFEPYRDARFSTVNFLHWGKMDRPLGISVGLDLFFDSAFTNSSLTVPSGEVTEERVTISLNMTNLMVQLLTTLAVDTRALGDISLGNFLHVDEHQVFTQNCDAVTCLLSSVYNKGMHVPQFTMNVSDIQGPAFRTDRTLFSEGFELFVEAICEIFVQLFKDDLPHIMQGPLRNSINEKLDEIVSAARQPGACPERRNYTATYPLGEHYCSHNDTQGLVPARTQNEAECVGKGGGGWCSFEPPDAVYEEFQTQCVYSREAVDLDFSRAHDLQKFKSFVNTSLLNPDSAFYINLYLGALVGDIATEMHYTEPPLRISYLGNNYGTARLGIGRFRLTGLDTMDRLSLFDNEPYSYPNGEQRFVGPTPDERRSLAVREGYFGESDNNYTSRLAFGFTGLMQLGFDLYLSFDNLFVPRPDNPSGVVTDHISLTLELYDVDMVFDLFMLINIPRLMDLQIRSLSTIYELPCILAIFEDDGLIPVAANITYGQVGFVMCCESTCNSPFFMALQTACFTSAANSDLSNKFTEAFNQWTEFVINFIASSSSQDFLNARIAQANTQCEAIKSGLPAIPQQAAATHVPAATYMGIAGISAIFATLIGFAFLVPVHFRRRDDLMKRALLDAHSRGVDGKSREEFELAERRMRSAFDHPVMHRYVKWSVPLALLFNVVMFATANFGAPGATVVLTLSIAGDTTYPIPLLAFTLESSIDDMWNSGAIPLAIIIAVASGGWTYAKQILLGFAWFAPSTILRPSARGSLLEVLDNLGKWSIIDLYVMIMLMVGFRFFISSSMVSKLSLIPPEMLIVDVAVQPGWGLYGFMLGVLGSLLINHLMIFWNRKVLRSDEDLQDAILGQLVTDLRTPRIPLMRHRFNILDQDGRPYRYSAAVRVVYVAMFFVMIICIIVGCALPVIRFNFKGVAGLAFGAISEDLGSREESILSIGARIIDGAPKGDTAAEMGIVFMQIVYMLFAFIVPLLLCAMMIVIWAVPLTLKEQVLLYFIAEVASAWEALLVMVISVIATILQISTLAQFIVSTATGSLCDMAKAPLRRVFPDPEDAQCFDVVAELVTPQGMLITVTGFVLVIWLAIAFRLVHVALNDRELAMRRKPPHSPGEMTGLTGFLVRRSLEAFGPKNVEDMMVVDVMDQHVPQAFTGEMGMSQRIASGNPMFTAGSRMASVQHGVPSVQYGEPQVSVKGAALDV